MPWIIELHHRGAVGTLDGDEETVWTERDYSHPMPTRALAERLARSLRLSAAKPASVYDVTVVEVAAPGTPGDHFPERSVGNKLRYGRMPRALKDRADEQREGR